MQIDSKTAISYLLKMRITHNRVLFSKSIWNDFVNKQAVMSVEYLTSVLNVHAGRESQKAKENSEWELNVSVF